MNSKTITILTVLPMLVLAVALGAGTVAADPPAQLEADDAIAQLDETQEAADSLNETENIYSVYILVSLLLSGC